MTICYLNKFIGTTNDGQTARKAFQNYKKFAEITEIDETLIWQLHNILC